MNVDPSGLMGVPSSMIPMTDYQMAIGLDQSLSALNNMQFSFERASSNFISAANSYSSSGDMLAALPPGKLGILNSNRIMDQLEGGGGGRIGVYSGSGGGGSLSAAGRAGRQGRLRDLSNDDKLGSADRGWIQQEINSIDRGKRSSIRNPPGKDLAHERGREAAKGYGYNYSNLQDRDLHRLQHKYDNFGRSNKERKP